MSELVKNINFVNLLVSFLVAITIAVPARAAKVEYTKLTDIRLPYGESITITGKLSDLKRGNTKLETVMDIQSISLNYQVSGLAEKSAKAAITADRWQVAVETLPEKSQVLFSFQITGQLKEKRAKKVIDGLNNDLKFKTALQEFFDSAVGKEPATQAYRAQVFTKAITPIVTRYLPDELKTEAKETLSWTLAKQISLVNLPTLIKDLAGHAGVEKGMTPSKVYEKIKAANVDTQNNGVKKTAKAFLGIYDDLESALTQTIQTNISVETDLLKVAEIKDFEKFAGIDIGAIYLPKIDELRSFYTVNIYFGTVEDTPAPTIPMSKWYGKSGRFLKQRLSLTFGASIRDISSGTEKKIKGNNAFLYGLGFRINKYFRITAGASLYRTTQSDSLNCGSLKNTFFVGPSIDISALPFLRTLVGKNTN